VPATLHATIQFRVDGAPVEQAEIRGPGTRPVCWEQWVTLSPGSYTLSAVVDTDADCSLQFVGGIQGSVLLGAEDWSG